MADITAGLPTLRPEELQAQQDRARLEALGATIGAGAKRFGAAALDVGSLPVRGILGAANTALRVPNAFGANIPYAADNGMLSSLTPFSDRLDKAGVPFGPSAPALPAMTAPAPAKNTGGATGVFGDPVTAAAAPAPVQVSTPRTPKSGGTKTAGAMPAGAPAPLVPGETGFYMNDQLVPYGTRFDVTGGVVRQIGGAGGGGADLSGLPGGGKMRDGQFVDYRDAVEYGLQAQQRLFDYGRAALGGINGAELGAGSRMRALASMMGTNNGVGNAVSGANQINQAIASITSAETSAGATLGAAGIRAESEADRTLELARQFNNTPRSIGQTSVLDSVTGLTTNQTHFGMPAGAEPLKPIDAAIPKPKPVEGATGTLKDGRRFIIKNGEPVVVK